MNCHKTLAFIFLLASSFAPFWNAEGGAIDLVRNIASPNGRYTAKYVTYDTGDYNHADIVIMDNRTRKYLLREEDFRFDSMKWTKDSASLVIIDSSAESNEASILHIHGRKIIGYDAAPRLYDARITGCVVCRLIVKNHTMELTYIADNRPSENEAFVGFIDSFIINCNTGARSRETIKRIDEKTWERYASLPTP